jgi:hypothetical protein
MTTDLLWSLFCSFLSDLKVRPLSGIVAVKPEAHNFTDGHPLRSMQCADELLPGRQLLVCWFPTRSSGAWRDRLPLPGMSTRKGARVAEGILPLSVGVLIPAEHFRG